MLRVIVGGLGVPQSLSGSNPSLKNLERHTYSKQKWVVPCNRNKEITIRVGSQTHKLPQPNDFDIGFSLAMFDVYFQGLAYIVAEQLHQFLMLN